MNIFKTFETYLKEPLSVLRNNFFQIVSIQTGGLSEAKSSVDVSLLKNKVQFTVVNNEKLYNLLSLVTHKKGINDENKKEANKEKEELKNESA